MKKTLQWVAFAIAAIIFSSFSAKSKSDFGGSLTISLNHFVGDKSLVLDSITYHNSLNQPFTVGNFKYYISNISLTKADG